MSINPAIWRKALRLSSPLVLGSVLTAAAAVATLWGRLRDGYQERKAERSFLAAHLAEARRDQLTFPQVVVSYPAYHDKTVYWNVRVSSVASFAEGRPGWPILWTNPERVETLLMPYQDAHVLARVAAVREDTVYLEFLGRP
jgi:hypothetical protein